MGLINWTYGSVIIFLALDAWFLHILPDQLSPVAVVIMGVLVFLTPLRGQFGQPAHWTQKVRQYLFGAVIVVIGVSSLFPSLWIIGYENLPLFTTYSLFGQLILLAIGALYFFATSPRARMPLRGI